MPRYLRAFSGPLAIAICDRCKFKMLYKDLRKDPDSGLMVCEKCVDEKDPYTLPPKKPDVIDLKYPRPDTPLE